MTERLTRRRLLRASVGAIGTVGVWGLLGRPRPGRAPGPTLSSSFHDPAAVAVTGRVRLAQAEEADASTNVLWERLHARLGTRPDHPAEHVLRAAHAQSRREFADGELVDVDGWLLSPTQADVAAIVALERTP